MFIVIPVGVIHGVVKPDRQFHLFRMDSQETCPIEYTEAILDMRKVVIETIRRRIRLDQFRQGRLRRFDVQLLPDFLPAIFQGTSHGAYTS